MTGSAEIVRRRERPHESDKTADLRFPDAVTFPADGYLKVNPNLREEKRAKVTLLK